MSFVDWLMIWRACHVLTPLQYCGFVSNPTMPVFRATYDPVRSTCSESVRHFSDSGKLERRDRAHDRLSRSGPNMTCPSNMVRSTRVWAIIIGGMRKMSCDSTARSASLPGVSEPFSASSPEA